MATKKGIKYVSDTEAQVTKAFEKKACIFGTEEFKLWREYKAMFPKAQMITKTIKKSETQKKRRNRTYENMEIHINAYENANDLLDVFETVKALSKVCASPYKYVRDWFEAQFPDYKSVPIVNTMPSKRHLPRSKSATKSPRKNTVKPGRYITGIGSNTAHIMLMR